MRIALNYFWVDPARGGAETYVCDLSRRLVQAGHNVDLYAHGWSPGALPEAVRCLRVETSGIAPWQRIWRFAQNSARALEEGSYDCTLGFINTWHHDVIVPQAGVRAASIDHNALRHPAGWRRDLYRMGKLVHPKHRVYQAIEQRQYDLARPVRVVAPSKMVERHLERYHHVPREWIRVIPNAIDAERLVVPDPAAARAALRSQVGLREDDLVALFIGHNFWLKGLKPLLNALAYRKAHDPSARPIHLLVCGGGKARPFQAMAAALGLERLVHFLGFVPDVRACYWASDFFVLPTYYDPCSLVVFEALACGLPVITTFFNGAGELIRDAREGYVIPAPDARSDLIYVMDKMTNDAARSAMSQSAARLGRAQSFENHFTRLMGVLEGAARAKAVPRAHWRRSGSEALRAAAAPLLHAAEGTVRA